MLKKIPTVDIITGKEDFENNCNGFAKNVGSEIAAIFQACSTGSLDDVKSLHSTQPNLQRNYSQESIFSSVKDNKGNTALHLALLNGRCDIAKFLIEKNNIDVNKTNDEGVTPLAISAELGYSEIVGMLLDHGADVNARFPSGYSTALLRAAANGHASVVECLLKRGKANANDTDTATGYTAFMLASKAGNLETLRQLVINRAKVNVKGKDGSTALSLAHDELVERVVQSQLVSPMRPIQVVLFVSFAFGLTFGYLLSFLPKHLRNS